MRSINVLSLYQRNLPAFKPLCDIEMHSRIFTQVRGLGIIILMSIFPGIACGS